MLRRHPIEQLLKTFPASAIGEELLEMLGAGRIDHGDCVWRIVRRRAMNVVGDSRLLASSTRPPAAEPPLELGIADWTTEDEISDATTLWGIDRDLFVLRAGPDPRLVGEAAVMKANEM